MIYSTEALAALRDQLDELHEPNALREALRQVIQSHADVNRSKADITRQRDAASGVVDRVRELVTKWRAAQRWDGQPDIVTRAYAAEVAKAVDPEGLS